MTLAWEALITNLVAIFYILKRVYSMEGIAAWEQLWAK